MRYNLFFIFLSFYPIFLFAQDETGETHLVQNGSNETKEPASSQKMEEVSALITLFEKRQVPLENVPFFSDRFSNLPVDEFLPGAMNHIKAKHWIENYAPGPLFNTCLTLVLSVRCYWAILRMDRLTDKNQELQVKEMINSQLSFENFKEEVHRLQTVPFHDRLEVTAWFLFLALEFQDWATEQGISDPERLFPAVDEVAKRILSEKINYLHQPLLSYALYRYFQRPGYEEQKQELLAWITSFFLQRNDETQEGLEARTAYCASKSKLAGIHRNYLEENGLILSGYEEFEALTASEDTKRMERCVGYLSSGIVSSFSAYGSIIALLDKMGGTDAVRYFVRHNPIPRNIPFPKLKGPGPAWVFKYWHTVHTFSILRDIHDDVGWKHQWQEIIAEYERALLTTSINKVDYFVFVLTWINVLHFK